MTDDERQRPKRVRFTKLQEAQVADLVRLEHATAGMYHEIGFDTAEVPPRAANDISGLPHRHSVIVAEADHVVAGYAAWRDEAPGVAYVEELGVHPDFQRFGIGKALIDELRGQARDYRITEIVLRMWQRAEWAAAFYKKLGFEPIDDSAPLKVRSWFEAKNEGRPMLRPGELALWAPVGPAPVVAAEDEEEEPLAE